MNAARERALLVFPNDPANQAKYLDTLQSRIRSDNSMMEQAARQMQLDMKNTVMKELINDPSIVSYDKLSPTAKQAYDLSPESQQAVAKRQMLKNATADVPLTADRQNLYDTIYGEALGKDLEKFMGRNISELDLPRAQKSKLQAMQAQREALVQKGMRADGIIKDSQALLNDAGIRPSVTDSAANKEFEKFKGVLDQQVETFMNENKRPPNPKEGREMVKDLTREIVTQQRSYWFDAKSRGYQAIADKTPIEYSGEPGDFGAHYATIPRGATYRSPDGSLKVKR